jgi:hypothetical protein
VQRGGEFYMDVVRNDVSRVDEATAYFASSRWWINRYEGYGLLKFDYCHRLRDCLNPQILHDPGLTASCLIALGSMVQQSSSVPWSGTLITIRSLTN